MPKMAAVDLTELVSTILQSLKSAPLFASQGYERKLRLACRDVDVLKLLAASLSVPQDGDDVRFVGSFPRTDKDVVASSLNDLGLSTMVLAMAGLEHDYDSGFKEAAHPAILTQHP